MSRARIEVFRDPESLALGAARRVIRIVRESLSKGDACTIVLAGGSTPEALYRTLSREPHRSRINWSRIDIFWGDERAVPPDHVDSNYRMAREALLSKVPLLPHRVQRIAGELGSEGAAADYERRLRSFFAGSAPIFDLVLLGVGRDGHTASLFPATPDLSPGERLVIATSASSPPRERVSLTRRALGAARAVIFLAQGASKAEVVAAVLDGHANLPAARISPRHGTVSWMVDESAAARLAAR